MRVLYLINSLSPGGAERSLVATAAPLADHGVDIAVAYLHETPGLQGDLAATGVEVIAPRGSRRSSPIASAISLARSRRPDIIHTTLTEANVVGRIAGTVTATPVVSSLVNVLYGTENRRAPREVLTLRTRQLFDAVTAQRVVRFHAITNTVADAMARRLRVPRWRIDVVPRGRDPVQLGRRTVPRRDKARAELGVGTEAELVVCAAHHHYQKGLDVLLEAMAVLVRTHPGAQLVVAGAESADTAGLAILARRLGLLDGTVRFLGSRNDVPDLMCAADVFVLSSRWEGMGGVLLEAMALEAPIVVSDLAVLREVVPDDRYARFAPPGRPEPLAAALSAALADLEGSAARAVRARQRFLEHFTVERVVEEMAAFYRKALDEASARGSGGP